MWDPGLEVAVKDAGGMTCEDTGKRLGWRQLEVCEGSKEITTLGEGSRGLILVAGGVVDLGHRVCGRRKTREHLGL